VGGWKIREGKNGDMMTETEADVVQGRGHRLQKLEKERKWILL